MSFRTLLLWVSALIVVLCVSYVWPDDSQEATSDVVNQLGQTLTSPDDDKLTDERVQASLRKLCRTGEAWACKLVAPRKPGLL